MDVTTVSLNIDLGELPDEDEDLVRLATMVNIACGGHAGDASTMERTITRAMDAGARIAAHPSYPDREGFGRKTMGIEPDVLARSIAEQIGALVRIAARLGAEVVAVKPHGALYHDAARDPRVAAAFFAGMEEALARPVRVVGPPRGELLRLSRERGWPYLREGFADRAYQSDGTLVPRSAPGALLEDPLVASEQAARLAASGEYDTLCVHGDTQGAAHIARSVREKLAASGRLEGASP